MEFDDAHESGAIQVPPPPAPHALSAKMPARRVLAPSHTEEGRYRWCSRAGAAAALPPRASTYLRLPDKIAEETMVALLAPDEFFATPAFLRRGVVRRQAGAIPSASAKVEGGIAGICKCA